MNNQEYYYKLLDRQENSKRIICSYNENIHLEPIVTTGIPRQYNDGKPTFVKIKNEL